MDRRTPNAAAGTRVYQAIKARAVAYAFPQGRRIYLQPLADAFGVSTMPIRDALHRLAAEGLVIKAPRKGYIARSLSGKHLLGYYELTRLLLAKELQGLDMAAREMALELHPVGVALYKLNRRVISDANTLAACTGEIFSGIASLGNSTPVILLIDGANDHLYYIRTVECRNIEGVQEHLRHMCDLLLEGRCADLLQAIHRYHAKRIEMLPMLVDLARRQAHLEEILRRRPQWRL